MSSLRGEEASKDGISFEFTWAIRHLIEVMGEHADAIMLGGMPSEKGVDFRLYFKDREEHHQVKRGFRTKGDWSLADLNSEGVLPDFRQRLEDPKVHCFMVSGIPATRLGYLANRARKSSDLSSFETHYLTGEYQGWFNDLVKRWGLSREETWTRLHRVHICPFDEDQLKSTCLTLLRVLVLNDAEDAWTHLKDFCFGHVSTRVTSSMLWNWLEQRGIQRHIVNNDPRVIARIGDQTKRYLEGVRQKLIKPPLRRELTSTVVHSLTESSEGKDVVILGSPGGGKSAVMLQIAESCIEKGWPVLAFRLDDLSADLSVQGLQIALDLPDAPATCMARASAGNPALVIIDQLDAVSEYSGRTGQLLSRVSELIQQLRAHRERHPIHLIISCREVDWRYDGHLRQLHDSKSEKEDESIHKLQDLKDEEIRIMLQSVGLDLQMFSPLQKRDLLSRPQYLALFIETRPNIETVHRIVTSKLLFDAYWDKKKRALARALPFESGSSWFNILQFITDKLAATALSLTPAGTGHDESGAPLAVAKSSLDQFSTPVIDWIISNGVLAEGNQRIRFGHESFFDYCFARLFEARKQSLLEYLLTSDQTLIQRGQLRQVLAYQRDQDLATYIDSARDILLSIDVRPHLKNLLATVICNVLDPKDAEWDFIHPIISQAVTDFESGITSSVHCQVFYSFSNSLPFFKLAFKQGQLAKWLKTSGDHALERLFWAVGKHQKDAQQEVWELISPLINQERYQLHLARLSHYCNASQSRETFEWLLNVRRSLNGSDHSYSQRAERFYSLTEDLATNRPEWLAEWLAVVIVAKTVSEEKSYRYEILDAGDIEGHKIKQAAENAPEEFLKYLIPALTIALKSGRIHTLSGWHSSGTLTQEDVSHHVEVDEILLESLLFSLLSLFQKDQPYALRVLDELRHSDLPELRSLHSATLCANLPGNIPLAADYLRRDPNALSTFYQGKFLMCLLLEKYGTQFHPSDLEAIEVSILDCWPKHQNNSNHDFRAEPNKICFGNNRGYTQMTLLRSFPPKHLSVRARRRLEEWERKFDSTHILYPHPRKTSLVNQNALAQWHPALFFKAVATHQQRYSRSLNGRPSDGGLISYVLRGEVAKRPAEFIRFLRECDDTIPQGLLSEIDGGLMNIELGSELALEAAQHFHRLGSSRALSFLKQVKEGHLIHEAFRLALHYFQYGEGVTRSSSSEPGKKGQSLNSMAINSVRGNAIGVLRQMLWVNPDLLHELKPLLPNMMKDECPAIRTELASLCYAVAFKDENRSFATHLFLSLATENLPDEHVLASHWPFEFMRTGLIQDWSRFKPILTQMTQSSSSEVRCAAARLVTIGVISGIEDAMQAARKCAQSEDPKVRAVCAKVLSHNVDVGHGKPWTTQTLLALADDTDSDVCRSAGFGFSRSKSIDFSSLADFLVCYVNTRAFVRGSAGLVDALAKSGSLLPSTIFEIVETFINRLDEPVEAGAERLIWHIEQISPVLTRLYQENRDRVLRRRALDLIDKLCVRGHPSHESLDH